MILVAAILITGYIILIAFYFYHFTKLQEFTSTQSSFSTKISVIVSVRNEENTIPILATCLHNQGFPQELLEIIFINDHSTDRTVEVIKNSFLHSELTYQVISLKENETGKKSAITKGVAIAKGDLIILTDADCIMNKNWLNAIVAFYEQNKPAMIVMPVLIKAKTFFEEMQAMEFLSLSATTASSLAANFPLMCNGANLAFEKKHFSEGYASNKNIATGDDTFQMFHLHDKFKSKVVYLKSREVIVKTKAENTFKSFLHQRIRWTSKVRHYGKLYVVLTGFLIFGVAFMQASALLFYPLLFSVNDFIVQTAILFLPKAIIDFLYLKKASDYFAEKFSLPVFLLWQLFYPFYIISISVLSLFGKYEWKGRRY